MPHCAKLRLVKAGHLQGYKRTCPIQAAKSQNMWPIAQGELRQNHALADQNQGARAVRRSTATSIVHSGSHCALKSHFTLTTSTEHAAFVHQAQQQLSTRGSTPQHDMPACEVQTGHPPHPEPVESPARAEVELLQVGQGQVHHAQVVAASQVNLGQRVAGRQLQDQLRQALQPRGAQLAQNTLHATQCRHM